MSSMRPLYKPEPRARDRRSGTQWAHLRDVLRQPTGDRRGTRPAPEKHRALGRLLDRYLLDRSSRLLSWGGTLVAVAFVWIVAREWSTSRHLVPFEDAPETYERLATHVRQSCEAEGICSYGWSRRNPVPPPPEVRALMARVRARDVGHDPALGWTTVRGYYNADFALVREWAPTPWQMRGRESAAERERAGRERAGLEPAPAPQPVHTGWIRLVTRR